MEACATHTESSLCLRWALVSSPASTEVTSVWAELSSAPPISAQYRGLNVWILCIGHSSDVRIVEP